MKLLLSGLGPDTDIDRLQARMHHFGPVLGVHAVREGDPERPWFIVAMDITPDVATEVARRIDGIYFHGSFVHARVMLHD